MGKIDLEKYDKIKDERWQYSWPGCEELDTYLYIKDRCEQMVGQVRGWGYLSTTYGDERAKEIQDLRGELMADAPILLARVKELEERVGRLNLLNERLRGENELLRVKIKASSGIADTIIAELGGNDE